MLRSFLKNIVLKSRTLSFNRELENWLAGVGSPDVAASNRTVVFNTVRSNRGTFHLYTDFFLGHFLARSGCTVHILLDDGFLRHWDSVQRYRVVAPVLNPMHSSLRHGMKRNVAALEKIFQLPGLNVHWYSDFLADAEEESVDEDVERYALASTLRHFELGYFEPDDEEQQAYYHLSLENAKLSKAIGRRVIEQLRPDVYATSHGIYSTWGPAYSYVRRSGTTTLVYAHHPYHLGGFMLDDAPGGSLDREALEQYLLTAEFDTQQRATAETYLNMRYSHQSSDTREYFENAAPQVGLQQAKGNHEYAISFGFFPNVAWDAIGEHLVPIYDSVIEWLVDSIRTLGRQGRHRVVVRFHPAENTRMKGTLSTEHLVRAKIPEIADYRNVVLIGAQDPVSSYELLRNELDVAVVYTGTLGAEAQPLGVPVVSAASGRFSEHFVHVARDQDEYRSILDNPEELMAHFAQHQSQIVELVMKYHYYISEELFYPVPIMSGKGRHLAAVEELRARPAPDLNGLARTLRRFLR